MSAAVTAKVLKTLEGQLSNTILLPPAKPPMAMPLGAKPAGLPPVAQLIQQGRNAPPAPAGPVQAALPPAALAPQNIQVAPTPAMNGVGKSLTLRANALRSWLTSLSPRQKVLAAVGGAAVVAALLLLPIVALMWRGGGRSSDKNPVAVKDGGTGPDAIGPGGVGDPYQKILRVRLPFLPPSPPAKPSTPTRSSRARPRSKSW